MSAQVLFTACKKSVAVYVFTGQQGRGRQLCVQAVKEGVEGLQVAVNAAGRVAAGVWRTCSRYVVGAGV